MNNDFYVYIYWRLDTNEPFYVGKGYGRRWKALYNRNIHFINVANKYPIMVEIVKNNLTEDEAFYWEEKIIETLVFEYGFSIDIKGCNSDDHYCHLVNQTWGGEGASGYTATEEARRKMSESRKGEKNPFYGRCFKESMSKETYDRWMKRRIECGTGENNPMYGKHGKDNPNSKSVICLTTKKIFYSTKEAGKYYNCDASGIAKCCRGDTNKYGYRIKSVGKYNGQKLVWRYLIWNHGKVYRICNN